MISDENIKLLTNHFVKMAKDLGFSKLCGGGRQIALFKEDDGWTINLVESTDLRLRESLRHFDYPTVLPEDELDAAIELAGIISSNLHRWSCACKASKAAKESYNKLSPAERSARAKKAVEARMKKYGQKPRK